MTRRSARRPITCSLAGMAIVTAALTVGSRPSAQTGSPPPATAADTLYNAKCALCHGAAGDGNGAAAAYLVTRPRDFRQGRFKVRTTETGHLPTDEDLKRTIREGMHSTSMPAWQPFLSDADVTALVVKVKSFSPRFEGEPPTTVMPGAEIPSSAESVAAGQVAYDRLICAGCHGTDGAGTDAIATDLADDWGMPTRATNLTEPWTFRGGAAPSDIFMRLRTGMNGTPMPSYTTAAADPELWHVANYVASLGRKPVWKMTADEVNAFYGAQDEAARSNAVERGRYLVNSLSCHDCHTPVRTDGSQIEELSLAGGQRWRVVPYGDRISANLTSDKETGLGNVSDDQIKGTLTKGLRRDGTRMLPFPMPWPSYANLKPGDLDAVIAYLRTRPPVINRIPAPTYPNTVAFLIGKFRWLILGNDPPSILYPDNAGSAQPKAAVQGAGRPPLSPLALATQTRTRTTAYARKGAER